MIHVHVEAARSIRSAAAEQSKSSNQGEGKACKGKWKHCLHAFSMMRLAAQSL